MRNRPKRKVPQPDTAPAACDLDEVRRGASAKYWLSHKGGGRHAVGRSGRFFRNDRAPSRRRGSPRISGLDEYRRRQSLSQWPADRPRSRLDQPVRCATDRSEFVWIGLFEPSEAELRQLQENYDLHPLAIEDALLAHQLPKLDIYGDQLFVVARPAHLADGQIAYGETSVFIGETFIISVRHGSERAHSGLRQQLESSPGLLQHGVDYVLHAILDFIVETPRGCGMGETRKLAAILVADVVGYSRLAAADEDRTLARRRGLRSDFIDPAIAARHGRVVKRTGDGSLVEFRSVVDAVRCAIEVQHGMLERNAGLPPERRDRFSRRRSPWGCRRGGPRRPDG